MSGGTVSSAAGADTGRAAPPRPPYATVEKTRPPDARRVRVDTPRRRPEAGLSGPAPRGDIHRRP
ncbi:hypothetical protein [Streptomyces sp. NPDC007088]|uniref:hypothetical protein n=1 Tax=Streptomyces sp. NPDC007088 TaxID=3364773 RepID=UPI0036A617F8